ncbi:hypothetical protein FRC19_006805, partial [Serendipita sp. 401]
GALGAKGNSPQEELQWKIIRNANSTYTLQVYDPANPGLAGTAAGGGQAISEVNKRYYVSVEGAEAAQWRLQPVLQGSNPQVLYAIYQDPRDNPGCETIGHWELNKNDKKEPVKLNRDPSDDENNPVPLNFTPIALWVLDRIGELNPGAGPGKY